MQCTETVFHSILSVMSVVNFTRCYFSLQVKGLSLWQASGFVNLH